MASNALEMEVKALQAGIDRHKQLNIKKHLRWLLLKRTDSLTEEQLDVLFHLEKSHPELKEAYDFKEQFNAIYDAQTKEDAIQRFTNWEADIPKHLASFRYVAKTVNNRFEDVFSYWDAPMRITNTFTEGHNSLIRAANRMGRGYTFEVLRAKMLYNKVARSITTLTAPLPIAKQSKGNQGFGEFPTMHEKIKLEYGAYLPTLVELYEGDKESFSAL